MIIENESYMRFKAINMYYNEGIGKNKIRKQLKISIGKLNYWIRDYARELYKKDEALNLYFKKGNGRFKISKELKLDEKILDKWINEEYNKEFEKRKQEELEFYKKNLAHRMYFTEGRNKRQILNDLDITKAELEKILNNKEQNYNRTKIQNGYSTWISNILSS